MSTLTTCLCHGLTHPQRWASGGGVWDASGATDFKDICWGKSRGRVQGVHTPLPLWWPAAFQYSYTKSAVLSFDCIPSSSHYVIALSKAFFFEFAFLNLFTSPVSSHIKATAAYGLKTSRPAQLTFLCELEDFFEFHPCIEQAVYLHR